MLVQSCVHPGKAVPALLGLYVPTGDCTFLDMVVCASTGICACAGYVCSGCYDVLGAHTELCTPMQGCACLSRVVCGYASLCMALGGCVCMYRTACVREGLCMPIRGCACP